MRLYLKGTIMRKFKLLTLLVTVCLILSAAAPTASALDPPRLKSADAYLVVDMKTGTELVGLNPDMQHSIASLTKIMTCLLAVEAVESGKVSLEDRVVAQDDCLQGLDVSSSNAGITPGEEMSFKDILYCALVHSANDACNVIAVQVAGSIGSFVDMMNAKAQSLGCQNTHFVDTDGMLNRSEGHYSSPRDLYTITKEALSHPLFAQICSTADYTVPATNKREAFEIHNSNALMSTKGIYGDQYIYSGVTGVKTGFTKPAGYCLVSVCSRQGEQIMCIVLGCNGPLTYTFAGEYQNFQDSITLYDWSFKNFSGRTVFLAGEPLKRIPVQYARDGGTVALCPDKSLQLFLANEVSDDDIVVEVHPDENLTAPISAGEDIGYANVFVAGELRSTVRMVADASVEMERSQLIKDRIHAFFTSSGFKLAVAAIVVLIIAFFVLRSYRKAVRRRRLRAKIQERDRGKWTEQNAAYAAKEEARRRTVEQRRPPVARAARPDQETDQSTRRQVTHRPASSGQKGPERNTQRQDAPRQDHSGQRRVPIERIDASRVRGDNDDYYDPFDRRG